MQARSKMAVARGPRPAGGVVRVGPRVVDPDDAGDAHFETEWHELVWWKRCLGTPAKHCLATRILVTLAFALTRQGRRKRLGPQWTVASGLGLTKLAGTSRLPRDSRR